LYILLELSLCLELREQFSANTTFVDLLTGNIGNRQEKIKTMSILALANISGGLPESRANILDEECIGIIRNVLERSINDQSCAGLTISLEEALTPIRALSGNNDYLIKLGDDVATLVENALEKSIKIDDPVAAEVSLMILSQFALNEQSEIWLTHKRRISEIAAKVSTLASPESQNWDGAKKVCQGLLSSQENHSEML